MQDEEAAADEEDGGEDWGQPGAAQPKQAAPISSREATPLGGNAYLGVEAADDDLADGDAADGDWQQYDDGEDDEDDVDDDKDEDYH